MLKAVKECVKNWLVTHERLYWYIVVGLAVLGFGIVTALGCAKLEQANAAVDVTTKIGGTTTTKKVYDLWEMDWSYWLTTGDADGGCNAYDNPEELYKKIVKECNYMYVTCPSSSAVYIEYYYSTVPFEKNTITGTHYSVKTPYTTCYYIYVYYGSSGPVVQKVHGLYDNKENTSVPTDNIYNNKNFCLGSSYDILGAYASDSTYATLANEIPRGNLTYPVLPLENVYSAEAPYLKNVTYSNVNLFMIDGNTDFDASTFSFKFDIADDGREYEKRTTQLSGYVYLPSKDFIDKAVQYYMGGRDTLDEYYSVYSCEQYPTWLKSLDVGDGSTYKKWYFTLDIECADTLEFRISHEQLYELVEQCNSVDLREYYGISDVAYIDHILKGYMWVHRLDGIVYTTYSDVVNYGNHSSFVISTYLKDPIVVIGNSDPLLVGPMLPDDSVQESINQAYKDALEEAIKENEDLNNSLDGYLDTNGAYGNLEGSDLWASFRSLADGLASMAPSVRAIASLSGAVLAFMPLQVTGMISFTLVALCIVAIIKAIRG